VIRNWLKYGAIEHYPSQKKARFARVNHVETVDFPCNQLKKYGWRTI